MSASPPSHPEGTGQSQSIHPLEADDAFETHSAERKEGRERALTRFSMVAFAGDFFFAALGMVLAWYLRFEATGGVLLRPWSWTGFNNHLPQFLLGMFVLLAMLVNCQLYDPRFLLRVRSNVVRMLKVIFYWGIGFLSISLMLKVDPPISRIYVGLSMVFVTLFLVCWRWSYSRFLGNSAFSSLFKKRVLAVGWNDTAQLLYEKVYGDPRHPISIQSAVTTIRGNFELRPPNEVSVEGNFSQLSELLAARRYDAVLLVDFNLSSRQIVELQHLCLREMTEFMAVPSFYQVLLSRLEFDSIGGIPIMTGHNLPLDHPYHQLLKRVVDIAGALTGLVLFAPVMAYFCYRVYRESPGPVFYRQMRTGRNGKPFEIIKIRSMRLDAEKEGGAQWAKEKDPRRLRIGEFMRARNIDELPQFWNVLKGEMSLVGPRPERPELIRNFKYDIDSYNLRHAVKPGLTGWAAINGWRGDTDLRTRIAFDIEYMEKWSIWFDFYIMLKTCGRSRNAY
jgi:exopolysaccharide biosynthesis polyprenyl glycosylphosphotransferase